MPYMIFVVLVVAISSSAGQFDYNGQISGWAGASGNLDENSSGIGVRLTPYTRYNHNLSSTSYIELEAAANAYAWYDSRRATEGLKLYRLKVMAATAQSDLRIGLQKLNFGQAQLLRPLMWFDRVNPTDPLQMTSGVYGIRYRHVFLNNANIWVWGLYGNDGVKGLEQLPTVDDVIEPGGRLQLPLYNGEFAVSGHARRVNGAVQGYHVFPEYRIALDGKWDAGAGLWIETAYQQGGSDEIDNPVRLTTTAGTDYTFTIGNGLYVLAEHMNVRAGDRLTRTIYDANLTAMMVSYPFSFYDNLSVLLLVNWNPQLSLSQVQWVRSWNSVELNVTIFHAPSSSILGQSGSLGDLAGFGGRLMMIYTF